MRFIWPIVLLLLYGCAGDSGKPDVRYTDAVLSDQFPPEVIKIRRYFFSNRDSSLFYSKQLYDLGKRTNDYQAISCALQWRGEGLDYPWLMIS